MTTTDTHADWVDAARRKWADYQRVLTEAPDNHIAAGIRERSLVAMVPHLIDAYAAGPSWAEVEGWLKARRDRCSEGYPEWDTLNDALDDLREHIHTGTPLGRPVQQTEEK